MVLLTALSATDMIDVSTTVIGEDWNFTTELPVAAGSKPPNGTAVSAAHPLVSDVAPMALAELISPATDTADVVWNLTTPRKDLLEPASNTVSMGRNITLGMLMPAITDMGDMDENFNIIAIQGTACFFMLILTGVAVWTIPKLHTMRKVTRVLLINMSVAEMFVTLGGLLRFIAQASLNSSMPRVMCMLILVCILLGMEASMAGFTLISLYTVCVLKNATSLQYTWQLKSLRVLLLIIWVSAFGLSASAYLFPGEAIEPGCILFNGYISTGYLKTVNVSFTITAISVTVFQLMSLFYITRHHKIAPTSVLETNVAQLARYRNRLKRQRSMVYMVLWVWGSLLFTYGPVNFFMMAYHFCLDHCGLQGSNIIPPASLIILKPAMVLFIYLGRLPEFRRVLKTSLFSWYAACHNSWAPATEQQPQNNDL